MIATLSLALAATPADLAEQLPAARAQLDTCAREGCTDEAGARAAWLVAVGTYVDEGVADGVLAATVQQLDPALFAKLPDVLRAAASEPLAWAVADASSPPGGVVRGIPGGVLGGLELAAIHAVVESELDAFLACAAGDLARDPSLAGRIDMKFVVGADGSVTSTNLRHSTLDRPALEACVLERFGALTFPAPSAGIVIASYQLVFAADPERLEAAGANPENHPRPDRMPWFHVRVVAPDGAPVGDAIVRFNDELEDHLVNRDTGSWSGQVRYLPDGTERYFTPGDLVGLEVLAPGFSAQRVAFVPGRGKRHETTVVLTPRPFALSDDASPEARAAMDAWKRWQDAVRSHEAPWREMVTSSEREAAFEAARRWMNRGGGPDALELCPLSAPRPRCLP